MSDDESRESNPLAALLRKAVRRAPRGPVRRWFESMAAAPEDTRIEPRPARTAAPPPEPIPDE